MSSTAHRIHFTDRSLARLFAVLTAAALLVACGGGDKDVSQTAARVNKDEITVSQVNLLLQQQRSVKPEHADAAGRQILERLIDQQLAMQKADDMKLDRDPRVVQQLDAARREVLARAYAERVGEAAPQPTPEEVRNYYAERPALFRDRRVYSIQEISIEATSEQLPELREKLAASSNINEFVEFLKAKGLRFTGNQAVRAAEQLPLSSLDTFARMKDGQALIVPTATGAQVVVLAGSRSQPVGEEQARPAIEQYLLNERRRKLVEEDVKALRASAKLEYLGKFAGVAASTPPGSAASAGLRAPEEKQGAMPK